MQGVRKSALVWSTIAFLLTSVCAPGSLPDLVPIALRAPKTITNTPVPYVTISWTVKNQGSNAATDFVDGFYISTNGSPSQVLISSYARTRVEAGASYSATNKVQLPIGFSGNYTLSLKTDYANWIPESNESNNSLSLPV